MRLLTFAFVLSVLATTAASAGPVDSAIVAAMKIPDAPNYSWRTDITDDGRTYEITGATDRASDVSLVTMPMTSSTTTMRRGPSSGRATSNSNVATVLFKGSEQYVIQSDDGWRKPDEMPNANGRGGSSRGSIYGGPPGMGGPRSRSSRGRTPGGSESGATATGYSNLQNTLSRPHEEISVIVAGATDMKVEGDVVSGTLPENTAQLLLVHDGQKNIEPKRASGTFRLWIQNGVLVKYETRLEGVLSIDGSSGRRDVNVHQTSTTTLTQVGTTKVDVPPEAKKKLGV